MDSFAIGLKRAKRRRVGGLGGNSVSRPQAAAGFGGDDSDEEKPRAKPVARVVGAARIQQQLEVRGVVNQDTKRGTAKNEDIVVQTTGEKGSQVSRLIQRRRRAEHDLQSQALGEGKEEALFRYDVDRCPEQAALTAYKSTPVDGFGAAMLRSMGWKGKIERDRGGSPDKTDSWTPKLRPPRLGLGAKLGKPPALSTAMKNGSGATPSHGVVAEADDVREVLEGTESEDEVFKPQERPMDQDGRKESKERNLRAADSESEGWPQRASRSRKRSRFANGERQCKD